MGTGLGDWTSGPAESRNDRDLGLAHLEHKQEQKENQQQNGANNYRECISLHKIISVLR
jgi:hypothetical protein